MEEKVNFQFHYNVYISLSPQTTGSCYLSVPLNILQLTVLLCPSERAHVNVHARVRERSHKWLFKCVIGHTV